VVPELREDNNELTASPPVAVSLFRPDLTITAFTAPAAGQTNRPLTVNATLQNVGAAAASGFRITLFMSAGDATPGAGTAPGFRALKGLAAGADLDVTATVTVPCGLDAGPYFLSAVVDSGGVVAELVEHNNGLTASTRVDVALWRPGLLSVVTGDSCQLTGEIASR
jgi:subtilase family serine protease